ncbi:MAG: endonuclease/exonuclease/phosphatase family protein, partial [Candidatus Thiodiazotropha sp. (ex Lucinoma kastoroae)]|nr:endonuclease/exonuclease/phosphatase family protein [Candidatus Thiodiazotropha sp. (ex Lucinoma kastoroae)]
AQRQGPSKRRTTTDCPTDGNKVAIINNRKNKIPRADNWAPEIKPEEIDAKTTVLNNKDIAIPPLEIPQGAPYLPNGRDIVSVKDLERAAKITMLRWFKERKALRPKEYKTNNKIKIDTRQHVLRLNIMTVNVHSIYRRSNTISKYLHENRIDIAAVQELWLIKNKTLKIRQYKFVHTAHTSQRAVGTGFLIHRDVRYKIVKKFNLNQGIEFVVIEASPNKTEAFIRYISVYIHPYAKKGAINFLMEWTDRNTVLMGDFNAHLPAWSIGTPNTRGEELYEECCLYNIKILGNKDFPTLMSKTTKTSSSPDLIAVGTKVEKTVSNWTLGGDIGSDHLPIHITVTHRGKDNQSIIVQHSRLHWILPKMDDELYKTELNTRLHSFTRTLQTGSTNQLNDRISQILLQVANLCCPKHSNTERRPQLPWWNNACEILYRKRNQIRKRWKYMIRESDIIEYNKVNAQFRKVMRSSKRRYWEAIHKKSTQREAYKIFKRISNPTGLPSEVLIKGTQDRILTDERQIAEEICKFFSSCGRPLRINRIQRARSSCDGLEILNRRITTKEILDTIRNMAERKAPGPDEIAPFMIKRAGDNLTLALLTLYNRVFFMGKLPKKWLKATIVPIPKCRKNCIEVTQFRPISLLSVVGKILEAVVNKRLGETCERMEWLPTFQNGFRKGRSTLNNLIVLQQKIHATFKKKEIMLAVFLDIKKAYDCVNRELLVQKLKDLGLKGNIMHYLKEFLSTDRYSRVTYGQQTSKYKKFQYGVPQGSPLSPLLFNIYTMDLKKIETGDRISQFADDIVIWESTKTIETAAGRTQKRLNRIKKYFERLGLALSPEKCIAVKFTRKRKSGGEPSIRIGGEQIKYANSAKYLGVTFDRGVTWKDQINTILKTSKKRVGIINFIGKHHNGLNQKYMITLYKSFVRPVLEYASEIWGDASKTNLAKLNSIQHKALTSCLGVNRLAHKKDVNYEACVLPLQLRRDKRILSTSIRLENRNSLRELRYEPSKEILVEKRRKNFLQKVELACTYYNITEQSIPTLSRRMWEKILIAKWITIMNESYKDDGRQDCFKNITNASLRYKPISNSRRINAAWHKARLGVVPTNDFLRSINRRKTNHCLKCNKTDTLKHWLNNCLTTEIFRKKIKAPHLENEAKLGTFLGLDKPPPKKIKIAKLIDLSIRNLRT